MHTDQNSSLESSNDPSPVLSDCIGLITNFRFPPAPRLTRSTNDYSSSPSEYSSNSDHYYNRRHHYHHYHHPQQKNQRHHRRKLPPLGIYWDIENCQVPKNRSASAIVNRIRQIFLINYREAEFIVVCDVKKERPQVIQELHDSQVNLIHVASISKNAADEKLRQSLRRFAEIYKSPSCVVLITSDINFAADLSDLRYRKRVRVILIHNTTVSKSLIFCANQCYKYEDITEDLPSERVKPPINSEYVYVLVTNLPLVSNSLIRNRLSIIVNNCGGKVDEILPEKGCAYLRFLNQDYADRAKIRIHGEDVFGQKIKVVSPTPRNFKGRKIKGVGDYSANGSNSRCFGPDRSQQITKSSPLSRRSRTLHETYSALSTNNRLSGTSDFSDDSATDSSTKSNQSVNLIISNLDPTIGVKELRRLLTNMLKEYVMILNLFITVQTDGTPIANIKVSSQQEAQFAISQLHRQKLGSKRIVISYSQNNQPGPEQLKAMVFTLLQEVPEKKMHLFKFIELLESRYNCAVSVSEVNKLKDICKITDDLGSRIISLSNDVTILPKTLLDKTFFLPYCTIHCPNGLQQNGGWCELNIIQSPNIFMPLKLFTNKLNELLDLHNGCMPLLSFQACYELEFKEMLPVNMNGVPLEHLISCVPFIEIKSSGPAKNIKLIKHQELIKSVDFDDDIIIKNFPSLLAPSISLLCRELVDLLKTMEKCQLSLNKFIPAYHHHFGRQCHVADYGYTKLLDLFESISHVIQIMGDGSRRMITLTHQAQMRRFTSDLLRVLKIQPNKQILIQDFPIAYEKVINRSFNPVEYGLCTFNDLLDELPDNTIVIINNNLTTSDISDNNSNNNFNNYIIALPKREQTPDEILRTKQFAIEVIDMLKYSPYCTILFNKFVPAYHHHFGYQCKVSNYGFSKLIELFEAIPDIVRIQILPDGERTISLTMNQSLKIVGEQIVNLLKNSSSISSIQFNDLHQIYLREYGYPLKPDVYDCNSTSDLIEKLSDFVQVVQTNNGLLIMCIDNDLKIKIRTWALLLNSPYFKDFSMFKYEYQSRFNENITINQLKQLKNVITITYLDNINYIALNDLYILAAQIYQILYNNNGAIIFNDLESLYYQNFGKKINLKIDFQINTIDDLYKKFPFLFTQCGYSRNYLLTLNYNLNEYQITLPLSLMSKKNDNQWHTTFHKIITNCVKRVSPPKPDTPPTPGCSPWSNNWCQPNQIIDDNGPNLSIHLPILQNPELIGDPKNLISPAKFLLSTENNNNNNNNSKNSNNNNCSNNNSSTSNNNSSNNNKRINNSSNNNNTENNISDNNNLKKNQWSNSNKISIEAPHPTELPMPDKLINKDSALDDSTDSGVNSKLDNSPSDNDDHDLKYNGAKPRYVNYI